MKLRHEVARFAVGGVLGFIVDAGIVHLLVRDIGWNPYLARVLSFLMAASVTWTWNRHVTFAHRRHHGLAGEWLRWIGVMVFGAAINYGIYALLIATVATVRAWPVLGVATGSACAAAVNFAGARGVVFNKPEMMP